MATGGSSNAAKLTMSEPRNARASAANRQCERVSQDGASVEDRLNNWEFLHWQPTALVGVSGKRVKRGNEEREKLKEWEGKDCPVCPEDSSPQAERKRRTPLTFPRTRTGQSTRHVGMENLRQHLTFSDAEELDRMSTDGERNNERYVQLPPKRDHTSLECNTMLSPATRGPAVASSARGAGRDNTVTRNLNHDDAAQPDSNQIVGRLMQIRDYIKQASTMMDKLHTSLDPGDMNRAAQLEQVILRLKEQEKKYLELLLELSVAREDNLFSGRHNDAGGIPNTQHETESETTELGEVQSDTTDGTVDDTRPRIEDHLGVHSDTDHDDTFGSRPVIGATALNPTPRPNDLDGNSDGEPQASPGHTTDLVQQRHILETDLLKKSDELEALKEQYTLLRKVLVQKEELQALQHRQATLLSLQEAAGNSLSEIRSSRNTGSEAPDGATAVAADSSMSPDTPKRDDSDATSDATEETADNVDTDNVDTDNVDTDNVDTDNVDAAVAAIAADMGFTIEGNGDVVPDDLRDLRHRLTYLKNLYDIKEQLSDGVNQVDSQEPKSAAELSALAQERHLLESKLQDLQQKKQHMDSLLSDLQSLRSQRQRGPSNNELEAGSMTSSQLQVSEVIAMGTMADRKSTEAQEVLDLLDTRNKMKKLHEVRDRLDQLKDLAQYYQGGSEFVRGADGATYAKESMSRSSEYDKPENTSEMGERDGMNEFLKIYQQLVCGSLPGEDAPPTASAPPVAAANPMGRSQPQGSAQSMGCSQPQGGAQAMGGVQAMRGAQKRKENEEQGGAVESFVDRGESVSQLSVDYGLWEDDPEVMAKVRRLQTAKEKLHRLQELVAMVQQSSSDAVQTLPSSIAELAAEVDLDDPAEVARPITAAVPHSRPTGGATGGGVTTATVPQPTVVTGCPFGQREAFYEAKVKQQQRTLEELMDEKCKLLAIQNELQRLHETLPQASATVQGSSDQSQQKDAVTTGTSSAIKRQSQQQNDTSEHRSNCMSTENTSGMATSGRGGPEPAQVTFQEPLETVVSNEELYDRMRQQRMLREELREKKRELEYMMSKDRPRKQYSRNQDTQSDNMSYSTKSDPFGASASVDVTMATWGGSTADNLESIEEDENVSGDGQECDDDNDDGYPSDGIMQVEEEEEANGESDDHATYTIEDEYASRRRQTSMPSDSQHVGRRRRRNKVRSAPQSGREVQNDGDYPASSRRYWPSSQSAKFLNDTRGGTTRQPVTTTRRRQYSKSSPQHPHHKEATDPATTHYMQQQLTSVRSDLNNVTQLLHILMRENPALATTARPEEVAPPPMVSAVPDMLSAPLAPVSGTTQVLRQQQQLIANLSHSFNELLSQQGELVQRFSQLERWLAASAVSSQNRNNADFTFDPTWDNSSAGSTLQGGALPAGSPLVRGHQWVPPGCATYDAVSLWSQPFDFQQHAMPGKAIPLKSPLQQHRVTEAPLCRGASTKELPFPIVSGDSGNATWRSGVVTGMRSRGLQTTFDNRTPTATELLASRDSIEVIKSSPALSSDRHRKFPDRSEPSIKFCEVPMACGATADSEGESDVESICIETIQATDTKEEIPRLDLSEVGARSHRSRTTPQAGTRQVGSTGFTGEAVVGHQFTASRRAGAAAKLASQLVKSQPQCTKYNQQSGKSQNHQGSQSVETAHRGGGFFPGLSSGISGTAFLDAMSNSSRRSSIQSSMAGDTDQLEASLRRVRVNNPALNNPALNSDVESDAPPSEFSLFEALRETIYSEVATLISQNENRPHFLIELFRELQLLTSDYLRQRALYAVQDLVTQYLAEGHKDGPEAKKVHEVRKKDMPWSTQPLRCNLSELTPSESIATSDDEEVKAHVYAQRAQSIVNREQKAQQMAALQPSSADGWHPSTHGCRFDYLENVEITSSQSTPSTSSSHLESPFARESLGDTVIHMDKMSEPSTFDTAAYIEHEALQSMREHECKLLEGECRTNESPRVPKSQPSDTSGMVSLCQNDDDRSDVGSSSAQDQGSEGSTSDVTYPRIDTQQLDGEIKSIMLGVLPVLQEHMDDVCSQQLLEYVRQLVLSLTKPKGDNLEFLQFFNNQLNTILSDSLAKFDGRKMRDCGEDLLGELSEILFNELAFFRLMEDLNSTKSKVKATLQQWRHQESQTSSDAGATAGERQRVNDVLSDASSSSSSSSDSADDWQSEESERSGVEKGSKEMKKGKEVTGDGNEEEEEEDLGKARDDAFAAVVDIDEREDEEKDTDTLQTSSVNFQLVPSELKPYTRIGSDEDDEGDDDEVASADDPSETAVSRDAEKDRINDSDDDTDTTLSHASVNTNHSCSEGKNGEETKEGEQEWEDTGEEECPYAPNGITTLSEESAMEKSCGDVESVKLADGNTAADGPVVDAASPEGAVVLTQKTTDAPVGKDGDATSNTCTTASGESDTATTEGATGTPSVNGEHVDGKLENGKVEGEDVTIDDLPPKLLLVVKDAGSSISPDVPLDTQAVVDMITPAGGELAGSSDTIKEPGSIPPNATLKQNGTD